MQEMIEATSVIYNFRISNRIVPTMHDSNLNVWNGRGNLRYMHDSNLNVCNDRGNLCYMSQCQNLSNFERSKRTNTN